MTTHPGVAWGFIPDTMKKRVLCLLSDGFEEVEFVTPVDILRRAGVEVVSAGMKERMATGRNGIRIEADVMIDDVDPLSFDLLFLPGGPGVGALREDGRAAGIARSSISEVLAGKKPFSKQMIRKLADYFKIDPAILAGNF